MLPLAQIAPPAETSGAAGLFIGVGIAAGVAAFGWFAYRAAVKLMDLSERRSVRRQAERDAEARDEKDEKKEYLDMMARVAQIQMESSLMLSEHRTLMTAAMTTVAVNLDRLTTHVHSLTAELRAGGTPNQKGRRAPGKELPGAPGV